LCVTKCFGNTVLYGEVAVCSESIWFFRFSPCLQDKWMPKVPHTDLLYKQDIYPYPWGCFYEARANMNYNLFVVKKMQRGPLKVVICGRWKHCSKVIHRPGVCYCAVLSVVRKMSKARVHVSMEQCIIIKFLTKNVVNRRKSVQV